MATREFVLPDLGEGLEEAEVTSWLVKEGDEVELNQPIAEIETAKATVEIPSPFAGVVAKLHAAAGATVKVGDPLVSFEVDSPGRGGGVAPLASPSPTPLRDAAAPSSDRMVAYSPRVGPAPASPAVRKVARDLGVDLARVMGTGPEGRITREDVEAASRGENQMWAATVSIDQRTEAVPHSAIRRRIANNLTRIAQIPQVTTFRTVDCLHLEAFRRERGVSPLPVVVKALAETCRDHPMLNATWTEDSVLVHHRVNVGVATDTDRGLLVPVVKDADSRSISAIAEDIARLAEAARAGSLAPIDAAGETITVSNTGSYGSEHGTPLLNPGNAVTLAIGVIQLRALVVDGDVVARPACTLSLTFDHRALDGAYVGRALTDLVDVLENRERLEALPK